MLESASDLFVFLDDDTPLDKSYLTLAREIKRTWPSLGVWGSGSVTPEYELQPDKCFSELLSCLGLRQAERTLWSNVFWCMEATPWGAGSCVRANVADAYRRMNSEHAPKERVSREYLLKLYEGTELSNALLFYKWKGTHPVSPLRPRGLLSIVKNSMLRRGLDRQMYFARMRAKILARRIIASSQSPRFRAIRK
jgi:hypothetical protein